MNFSEFNVEKNDFCENEVEAKELFSVACEGNLHKNKTNYKYIIPSTTFCGSPENSFFEEEFINLPLQSTTNGSSSTLRTEESIKPLDSVVTSVINSFIKRSNIGLKKYGTNLDRKDLSFLDWVQHAQEEHMDAILYLEKIKQMSVDLPPWYPTNGSSSTLPSQDTLRSEESVNTSIKIPPLFVYSPTLHSNKNVDMEEDCSYSFVPSNK